MKNGTVYATKIKKVFAKLRQTQSKPVIPEPDDPLRRLIVSILSCGSDEECGERAVAKLKAALVDWNEVRVSSAFELAGIVGNEVPDALKRCQQLVTVLRSIYKTENKPSLDRLKSMGRREAKQYLEEMDGTDEYICASVLLWSLGAHAVPVNDRLLDALRKGNLVAESAGRDEVQAFLERNIPAADAKEFCLLAGSLIHESLRVSPGRSKSAAKTLKE